MPSIRFVPTSFSNIAATGGARLVSPSRPLVDKRFAMNGRAYATPERVAHYLATAGGGSSRRDFPRHGAHQVDYIGVPNGGILRPEDTTIWRGTLFRVSYAPKGTPERQVVHGGVAGEWWVERDTFLGIVAKVDSASELLQHLRSELALGHPLEQDTTRIVAVPVQGPIAAYMGQGNPTSHRYAAAEFPILYGNPHVKQLYIPGIRDTGNAPDRSVIASAFDVDGTNSYDAVGALARFGRVGDKS